MRGKLQPECLVPSSQALLLRIMHLAGAAPVRLIKKHTGWIVRISPASCFYSYCLIVIIDLITLLAVILDLSVPNAQTVRMRTDIGCAIWIMDVIVVGLTANVGVWNAPAQTVRLIRHINRVKKINFELKLMDYPTQSDNVKQRLVFVSLFVIFFVMIADFLSVMYTAVIQNRQVVIAAAYLCYYLSYLILELLEMQFIMTASYVLSSMKLINYGLDSILVQRNKQSQTTRSENFNSQNTIVPSRCLNKVIDSIYVLTNTYSENPYRNANSTDAERIRDLSLSYGSVCDIIRQIDRHNGTVLLLLLASFLLHLVVTPYYMITYLFDHSAQTFWFKFYKPTFQLIWCLFHTIDLILLVEPCHRTLVEMDLTKELVSHLMCTTTSVYEPMSIELKLFCKRLSMNRVSYAPLKVCTLRRSLIATIFGSITTYLVVIVQF